MAPLGHRKLRYRPLVPAVFKPSSETGRFPDEGSFLHSLAARLFPINRSITGNGVRLTLSALAKYLPELRMHEVPSGQRVLDWSIPDEWNVSAAFIKDSTGAKVVDIADCNLHLVSYSEPVEQRMSLSDLQPRLHFDPEHRAAIPYVTSYYNRTWGFCISAEQLDQLEEDTYLAVVDSVLDPGSLTYADLVIPGETDAEVLISTYVCHPSLANNELSGPMVALGLALWLRKLPHRRYTYRFVFAPETIGAITYIDQNLETLRSKVVAGINLTCIGDDGDYSYLASRLGDSPLDRIAQRQVRKRPGAVKYTYLDRGSDERHYAMPGVDVPMISLMRTKYGEYPEYHTHLDDLTVVTPTGLQGGLDLVRDCIQDLESTDFLQSTVLGEPQLGRRNLYHTMHARTVADEVLVRTHILAYADGSHSVDDLADMLELPTETIQEFVDELIAHDLLVAGPLHRPRS